MNWLLIVVGVILFLVVDYINGKMIQKRKAAEQKRQADAIAKSVVEQFNNASDEFKEVFNEDSEIEIIE